ncbi:heme utilization cystosolic carrier protein HutX [Peteryoungia desertarenae]|uniref:Heme utilization cystosolic carrier protein HutX n=1 Tax=Peteryoungia desertarenae TaxID=1813451 RepID=A0ABX6QQQ3_9HYPH|nr:heme utilization cystosolic carrier protein HutX [Peteryoungia desertarenae]QLF70767.1 heme utilization cystosolic carrier protein HutX [Peteryoungia desertarenae]
MDNVVHNSSDRLDRAKAALAAKPDGVIEQIAAKAEVSPADVLAVLPDGAAGIVPADRWDAIWQDLSTWGDVLMIVHTDDIVLEVEGALPMGSEGHGWFNIHGDSPIGGHIRKDRCQSIVFVDRGFHGRRSCSVWFMNAEGRAMFKIFVRRDAERALIAEQLARFEALRQAEI